MEEYATPVTPRRIQGGFLLPLPYGPQVDWLKNVLATPQASLSYAGHTYQISNPRVIDRDEAISLWSGPDRILWKTLGPARFLRLDCDHPVDRPSD